MTLTMEEKRAFSDARIAKAVEFLEDARAAYAEGRYRTSVNRSYYAVLNAARAILVMEGANPATHDGIVTMMSLKFVKPGLLSADIIKKFKVLLSRRTDVDYGDFDVTDASDAGDSLKIAGEIIEAIDKVRKEMV